MAIEWRTRIKLPQSYSDVLYRLALAGPSTRSELSKGTKVPEGGKIAYVTVHGAIQELGNSGLVKGLKEKKWRTGLLTRAYELTPEGVVAALATGRLWEKDKLKRVLEQWSDRLPLPLRKWEYFASYGLEDEMKSAVEYGAFSGYRAFPGSSRSTFEQEVLARTFLIGPRSNVDAAMKLHKAIWADEELRRWATENLGALCNIFREICDYYGKTKEIFDKSEEPNWKEIEEDLLTQATAARRRESEERK